MNVALFASAYAPSLGGVEELCRQLAKHLIAQGHGVIVLTNRWPRDLPAVEVIDGVTVHRLPFRLPAESLKSKLSWLVTTASVRRRMMTVLSQFQPDVLHVQCVSGNAAYAVIAKRKLRKPLVVTLQGELHMDASRIFQRFGWARRVMRHTLQSADWVTACSGQTLREADAWFTAGLSGRSGVVHNGISIADADGPFGRPHRRPYVFAIGRHVRQKGFDVLIEAFKSVMADCDLIIAGDGDERPALIARAAGHVIFPGRLSHEQAMAYFAHAELFVLPSRHEPFGIVNLEAMAAGKAVVATNVGGVPEVVVDGVTGVLVPPEGPAALATAIDRLMTDGGLRDGLGRAGRQRAEGFDWSAITGQYVDIYRRLAAE